MFPKRKLFFQENNKSILVIMWSQNDGVLGYVFFFFLKNVFFFLKRNKQGKRENTFDFPFFLF